MAATGQSDCTWCGHGVHGATCSKRITAQTGYSGEWASGFQAKSSRAPVYAETPCPCARGLT